jgi:LytS/YehU family sensor histidine kinase
VENAVTHGIEPALRGGEIRVQTRLMGSGIAEVVVSDSGEGLQAPVCEGLGLSNTRQRLQAQSGPQASLTLTALQPQGCEARMTLPVNP